MSNRYEQVETGIYKYTDQNGNITYHGRPWINGKRSYRSLGLNFTKQPSLRNARTELAWRKTQISTGRNPYAEPEPAPKPEEKDEVTMGDVIRNYQQANYPPRSRRWCQCPRTRRSRWPDGSPPPLCQNQSRQ